LYEKHSFSLQPSIPPVCFSYTVLLDQHSVRKILYHILISYQLVIIYCYNILMVFLTNESEK
jgi:hypothetical protein